LTGTTDQAIRASIRRGRISTLVDGSIDPVSADEAWARNVDSSRRGRSPGRPPKTPRAPRSPFAGMGEASVAPLDDALEDVAEASAPARRDDAEDDGERVETMNESRARHERLKADLAELELRKRRGELVDVTDVGRALDRVLRGARDRFMALPDRLAPALVAETDIVRMRALLDDAVRAELSSLSTALERLAVGAVAGDATA